MQVNLQLWQVERFLKGNRAVIGIVEKNGALEVQTDGCLFLMTPSVTCPGKVRVQSAKEGWGKTVSFQQLDTYLRSLHERHNKKLAHA